MRAAAGGVLLLAVTGVLAAQTPEMWRHWRYSAPIAIEAAAAGGLVRVTVPPHTTERARRGWSDLRVIDSRGAEVPFVLHARLGGRSVDRRAVPLLEPSAVEGQYRQAIADTGADGAVHNSLRLRIDTTANLLTRVEIAVSGDLVEWRVVREAAPIYVLRAEGMGENTEVTYPDSVSRYVRIRVLDGSGTYTLRSAELGVERSTAAEREPSGITLVASTGAAGETIWTSDGDASHVPVSRVELESAQARFVRPVTVEASDDGRGWRWVATREILRVDDAAGSRAWLAIDFPEDYARHWRITVNHRNDAPIPDLRPVLMTVPRHVVFRAEPRASYRLLYGHPRAEAPRYDLARVTTVAERDAARPASLGAEVENLAWADPAPWTERYDALLWIALALAVLVLGLVAVRTLRSAGTRVS